MFTFSGLVLGHHASALSRLPNRATHHDHPPKSQARKTQTALIKKKKA